MAAFIITQCNEVFSVIRKIIEPGWNRSRPQFHILKDRNRNLVFKKPKKSSRLSSRNFEKQVHRNVSRGGFRKTIGPTTVMSTAAAVHGARLYFISMAPAARWRLGWPRRGVHRADVGRPRPAVSRRSARCAYVLRVLFPVFCQRPLGRPFYLTGSLVPVVCDVSSVFRVSPVLPAALAFWPGARHRSIAARGLPGERRRCERWSRPRNRWPNNGKVRPRSRPPVVGITSVFDTTETSWTEGGFGDLIVCVCVVAIFVVTNSPNVYIYIRHLCT